MMSAINSCSSKKPMTKRKELCFHCRGDQKRSLISIASSSAKAADAGNGKTRPWGDMCEDAMYNIACRLSHRDYVRLTAVCRGWRSIPRPPPPPHARSMLLMLHRVSDGACKLIDPARSVSAHVEVPEIAGATILASRAGWLLLKTLEATRYGQDEPADHLEELFFFCLATRQRIDLPVFEELFRKGSHSVAFSSSPDRADSVTVVIHAMAAHIKVFVWRPGDPRWILHLFENSFNLHPYNLVACGSLFYFQSYSDSIAVFDPASSTWRVLGGIQGLYTLEQLTNGVLSSAGRPDTEGCVFNDLRLGELGGELYLLGTGGRPRPYAAKVNASMMALEGDAAERMAECSVVVGLRTAELVVPADGRMANKLYFPMTTTRGRRDTCVHYCLKKRRYCPKLEFEMPAKLAEMHRDEKVGRVWIEGSQPLQDLFSNRRKYRRSKSIIKH